jgi:hypothetical protein
LQLSLTKQLKHSPPPIRETVLKYAEIRAGRRRGRRRGRRGPGRKPKKAVTQQAA